MSSVVGFDIGAKTCFVAVAKAGGVETIANEYSQRATPAYVSFGDLQRDLGTSAQQKVVMNLKSTAWLFKHFVGRPFKDITVERYQKLIPYEITEVPETGRVGIKVNHANQDYVFSIEQCLAMLLGKLKGIASTGLDNRPVSDCVIAVPYYLTNAERCAWLEAAEIAGLNPLRLMNETTAVALQYGLFKTDLPEPGSPPKTVAFVDIGYTQTQVSIAQFNKGTLKMVAVAGDRNLGGLDLDNCIANHFTEEFKTKYKMNVTGKKRAELRLYNECEKLKKLMSANATEMTMNVECIMDDKDVSGRMKRDVFENLCEEKGLVGKFKDLLKNCLGQLKDDVKLDSVEMVGGSSRVPWIREAINEVFGIAPSTTLNSDEAVSKGAALQCAILSPAFRVREFTINDVQPYKIRIDWTGSDGKCGNALLFQTNETIPISKVLTFTRKDLQPFTIRASYHDDDFSAYPDKTIGDYTVSDLKDPITPGPDGSIKIKVKLRMDSNGCLVIPQAVQIDKKEQVEEVKEEKPAEDVKSDAKPEEATENTNESETQESAPTDETPTEAAPPKTKTVLKPIKLELKVNLAITGKLNTETLQSYVQTENELCVLDKKERDRQDAKNQVESYVYEGRDKLYGEYEKFVEEVEREGISKTLTECEDWLYDEDYESVRPKSVYLEKYNELKSLMNPIVSRHREAQTRPKAIQNLLSYIQKVEKFSSKYNNNDESITHIEKDKVISVEKNLDDVRSWMNGATVKIAQMKTSSNPEVKTVEFEDKLRELSLAAENVMNTPKPQPKKEEEKKPEANESNEGKSGEEKASDEKMSGGDATSEGKNAEPEVNGDNGMDLD